MPTTIEIKGILEEKLELLVEAGLYSSKTEAIRDSIRHLLEDQDFLSIAINLYKNNKVSTGKAAEIANLTVADFISECQKRRVKLSIGLDAIEDLGNEMQSLNNQ